MPKTTDLVRVQSILDRDRAWSAYALGDLAPEFAPHCSWHVAADDSAIVLLFRGFDPPILFAMGDAAQLEILFRGIEAATVSLHVQPAAFARMGSMFRPEFTRAMWRMTLPAQSFRPPSLDEVVPVDESHTDAVQHLYDDGQQSKERPTFFQASMLRQGTFRGIWEGQELVAIAGTHQFSPHLGTCAIGNVYTRRDRRKRGLGARVTSAVVQLALSQSISTIVLNVSQANVAARRVYEQLGFHCHCEFLEGEAARTLSKLRT